MAKKRSKKSNRRKKKPGRGGPRPGSGRKPSRGEARTNSITVWLTEAERDDLDGFAEAVQETPALYAYDLLSDSIVKVKKRAAKKRRSKKKARKKAAKKKAAGKRSKKKG